MKPKNDTIRYMFAILLFTRANREHSANIGARKHIVVLPWPGQKCTTVQESIEYRLIIIAIIKLLLCF